MKPLYKKDFMPAPPAREIANKVIEMIDEGILDPKDIVLMCLKWMSEDDIKEMCKANDIDLEYDREDDYCFMCESEDI